MIPPTLPRSAHDPAVAQLEEAEETGKPKEHGVLRVPAFDLPLSELLSADTSAVLQKEMQAGQELNRACPIRSFQDLVAARQYHERHHYPALIARHRARYPVTIGSQTVNGVATQIVEPAEGLCAANRQRVLINLHGGGFVAGARWGGQVESIPIASVGKFKVVSIDYRMGPEHQFPAASEDVAVVYQALLKTYRSHNIGVYGCSAGGLLTAQTAVWLEKEGLPRPGALGMLCAAGNYWGSGDSGRFAAALTGLPLAQAIDPKENPYLKDADPDDPLVIPARSSEALSRFPPCLLMSSTRDVALSSVVHMHCRLAELGVKADLHVWEGLDHAFHYIPELPESREVYRIAARFFDEHLGQ